MRYPVGAVFGGGDGEAQLMRGVRANQGHSGRREVAEVRRRWAGLLVLVILFSAVVNALMLTGPIYMLQAHDCVLGFRSRETLVVLSVPIVFLFAMMGVLDHAGTASPRGSARGSKACSTVGCSGRTSAAPP